MLQDNQLKFLPDTFGRLSATLKELDLGFNSILYLPIEFGALTSLEMLNLEGNLFTNLPTTMKNLCHL